MKTLKCTKAQRLIVSALDEGLDRPLQEALDKHLAECPACREFQTETDEVLGVIRRSSVEDPGDAFWQYYHSSLDARLRSREPVSPGLWTWANAAFAAGFALILLVVGMGAVGLLQDSPTGNGGQTAAIREIDRLFGINSDDWFLYEPRLPMLVAGFDSGNGVYEASSTPLTDTGEDSVFAVLGQ
ncbi:MAG: anti-sigma factor [Thermodesulfobacteriota bacterium]